MTVESTPALTQPVSHAAPHGSGGGTTLVFDAEEVREFRKDDGNAAGFLGKMLASFFFYSLLVMLCVAWWTYRSMHEPNPTPTTHQVDDEEAQLFIPDAQLKKK